MSPYEQTDIMIVLLRRVASGGGENGATGPPLEHIFLYSFFYVANNFKIKKS